MSPDPIRYSIVADYQAPWAKMHEFRAGGWVKWEDYARLKAEVERLRKAGDDLCSTMEANGIHDNGDFEMHEKAIAQWNAAKEGKQS